MLLLTCLATCLIGTAPVDTTSPRPISQLVHTRWTAKDGAPTDIRALAQSTDGYLWLGTLSGLVRFDGVRFVPFVPQGGDTVPGGGVRRLLGTRDGSLWITWRSGTVSRLHGGRMTTYGEPDGLPTAFHLAESGKGLLVAATAKGLARFTDGKWQDVSQEWRFPGPECRAVWFDRDDALWARTDDRIVYRPSHGGEFVDVGMALKPGSAAPTEFAESADSTVWMAELYRSAHTVPRPGDQRVITEVLVGAFTLVIDRQGSLWIGTVGDGLRRVIDPGRIRGRKVAQFSSEAEQFTQKDGLLSDVVFALLEDREGNIWVVTGRGLERFRPGAFTPIAESGMVRSRWVYATRDTSVWTGGYGVDGAHRIGLRDEETVHTGSFLVLTLFEDPSGVLWTVDDARILRVEGRRYVPVPLRRSEVTKLSDITVDRSGTVWVYDEDQGLLRLVHDSLVQVASLYRPAWPHSSLFSDSRDRIWVAQMDRVALYDHGKVSLFGSAEGIGQGVVNTISEDREGNIWAAGEGGLSKFDGGRFRKLSPGNAIPGRAVFALIEDELGAWWLANQTGVLRLPSGELDRALADSSYAVHYRRFDVLDGLPGMVGHATWGSALTRSSDGRIWVGTDSGVASVDPRHLPRGLPPQVLIETMRVGGRELAPSEGMVIPPASRDLEIDYTATSLAIPERVQFRYQLEGEDAEWRDVGTRRRAYYTGLAPGQYRFRVIASNGDGEWNEGGIALNFRVLPAWYQTFWFRSALVLLVVGFGAAVAVVVQRGKHVRAQQALKDRYEATLAERSRIAQDLHDTLLQGIAGVSMQLKAAERALPDQPDVAAETLIQVQRLTRETVREARERILDLHEPDLVNVDVAGALESSGRGMVATTGIDFSLSIRGHRCRLPRPVEITAMRIGREAIANAVKHAEARRIEVVVGFEPQRLRLEVRDDGRGFTVEQGERARQQGHLGLSGMRNRAERAGGTCEVRPGQAGGTVVAVELPLSNGRATG